MLFRLLFSDLQTAMFVVDERDDVLQPKAVIFGHPLAQIARSFQEGGAFASLAGDLEALPARSAKLVDCSMSLRHAGNRGL